MKKSTTYRSARFPPEVITEAQLALEAIAKECAEKGNTSSFSLQATLGPHTWFHDDQNEFFSDLRKNPQQARYSVKYGSIIGMTLFFYYQDVVVDVEAPLRSYIERVFEVYERNVDTCRVPILLADQPRVFIGHGRSSLWRDLKDHLHEQHGFDVEAYETGARTGNTIRDVLEQMADRASFACLVLTAEDEQADGTFRARENVVHELGLFQGRLGFTNAIALLEEGANELSNIHGINQLRFHRGRINETFGDVLATLRREFGVR